MQALAPRWTSARTWALHIVPAPPVQNTTLLSNQTNKRRHFYVHSSCGLPKIPSFQMSLRYWFLVSGMVLRVDMNDMIEEWI